MRLGSIQQAVVQYLEKHGGKNVSLDLEKDPAKSYFEQYRPDHVRRSVDSLEKNKLIETSGNDPFSKSFTFKYFQSKGSGCESYVNTTTDQQLKQVAKKKQLLVGISLDFSGSMRNITENARAAYNAELESIQKNAVEYDIETLVTLVKCGVGMQGKNVLLTANTNALQLAPIQNYIADGHYTPLYSSIKVLIDSMIDYKESLDVDRSFLLLVVSDGADNSSRIRAIELSKVMKDLSNTGKWTFTIRAPRNYPTVMEILFPKDNILTWDQTASGVAKASVFTRSSLDAFYADTAAGKTNTSTFYKVDAKSLDLNEIKSRLEDISEEVSYIAIGKFRDGVAIRDFSENVIGVPYVKGTLFYALTKKEETIQPYKKIVIQDKKTGRTYAGNAVRELLNLPSNSNIKICPGDYGDYDIYVQTTSVNRKLVGGTSVIRWVNAV